MRKGDLSWPPPDQQQIAQFPFREFIQSSFLDTRGLPEDCILEDAPPPCTKDSCGEDICTTTEKCTDSTCNVAPCHDQHCSQFWDELEPCIGPCGEVQSDPCCDDGNCLEGWSLDNFCCEPHAADIAYVQQCHVDDPDWSYQLWPEQHQATTCNLKNSASVQLEPSSDEIGIIALTNAASRAEISFAAPALVQKSVPATNFGDHLCHSWHQPHKQVLLHHPPSMHCALHSEGLGEEFLGSTSNMLVPTQQPNQAHTRPAKIHTLGFHAHDPNGCCGICPQLEPQRKRRRLNTCCQPGACESLSTCLFSSNTHRPSSCATGCFHHGDHYFANHPSQQPLIHYEEVSKSHSQPYVNACSVHNWQVPALLAKHNSYHSHGGRCTFQSQPKPLTVAHQLPSASLTQHVPHRCCASTRGHGNVIRTSGERHSAPQLSHDLNSPSKPSLASPQSPTPSPEYIFSPDAHDPTNFLYYPSLTPHVKAESLACTAPPSPSEANPDSKESIDLTSDHSENERREIQSFKKESKVIKRESFQQPGKPKEASDTCKWVLNPDATSGEWITCNTRFDDPRELTAHFEMHIEQDMKNKSNGEKRFYCRQLGCDRCNNTPFQQKGKLVRHVKSHSKDQRFACEFCDKRFTTEDQRKTHVNMIHLGTKDHVCETCGRGFSSQNLLNNHKRSCIGSEEGKLRCPLCMYATHDSSNLGKHKKNCHPELTYRCLHPGCDFEPSQDFSDIKKHFSMMRHCSDYSEDGSLEQEEYKLLMVREARTKGAGKKSRWDPRPLDNGEERKGGLSKLRESN